MAPIFLVLALVTQCFFNAGADVTEEENIIKSPNLIDDTVESFSTGPKEWIDMFSLPPNGMFPPGPAAAIMAHVTNSNQTAEEQLEAIKEMADQMAKDIEKEMIALFNFAMAHTEKETDENGIRKKRSVETPMDSTQMVMKLLKHIKSNNEYQNVAIDKMMTAQEIADKFGIEFNPDPEILSDLAMAANDHAQEMTNLLKNACELKNVTEKVRFIPVDDDLQRENETYYTYGVHHEKDDYPSFEYMPEMLSKIPVEHIHYSESLPYHKIESQIPSPPVHHHSAPVTPKPSFYDPFMYPFSTSDFYSPYCSVEPIMPGLLIPIEEPEPEPELVGEEVEETITTKMLVEKGDEPGCTTVNHVTTYTISEKSHFKPPYIEKLPQQFQYCFFLM